jgi:hypothetical protein
LTAIYNDVYNKPALHVKIIQSEIDRRISTIGVTNVGRVPVSDVILTIVPPEEIIDHKLDNTENVTTFSDSGFLKLFIPRLASGEGSIIKAVIVTAAKNLNNKDYTVYATYNGGSIKVEAVERSLTPEEQFIGFIDTWGIFTILIISAVVLVIPALDLAIKKRRERRAYLRRYTIIIKSLYDTYYQNKEYCLKSLNDLQNEITQLYKIETINFYEFKILNRMISIYVSSLESKNSYQKKIDSFS